MPNQTKGGKREDIQITETQFNIFVGNFGDNEYGEEDVKIIQEGDKRKAIKIEIYQERWRTPEVTVKLLRALADKIQYHFINPSSSK
jgi:hypothetical protein